MLSEDKSNQQSPLQLKGSGAELSRRVQNLLTVSRVQANANGGGASIYIPGSTKIHEQSLSDMQEVRVTIFDELLLHATVLIIWIVTC